jgi:hypothetical protein
MERSALPVWFGGIIRSLSGEFQLNDRLPWRACSCAEPTVSGYESDKRTREFCPPDIRLSAAHPLTEIAPTTTG